MLKHFLSRQFLGFIAVGGLAALLHWLSRIILSHWMSFSVAVVFAYMIGMAVAFTMNAVYVFPGSNKPKRKQAQDFIIVNLSFLPVVWVISIGLERIFHSMGIVEYAQALAHAVAISVPMFATFLIYKFFAFKDA